MHNYVFMYEGIAGIHLDIVNIRNIVAMLLKYSPNVNLQDFEECTPLHHAVREPNLASVAEFLPDSNRSKHKNIIHIHWI